MENKQNSRINVLKNHLFPENDISSTPLIHQEPTSQTSKNPDDIVLVCPVRTAIGKGGRGSFKDTPPDALLTPIFKHILNTTKIDPSIIGDVNSSHKEHQLTIFLDCYWKSIRC